MAIALDTVAYARRLRETGFSEQQAEGEAQALAAAMTDSLAATQDLGEFEPRNDARFDGKLAGRERRITVRLGAIRVAGICVVSTLVKLR
jgi:hypothetical protein